MLTLWILIILNMSIGHPRVSQNVKILSITYTILSFSSQSCQLPWEHRQEDPPELLPGPAPARLLPAVPAHRLNVFFFPILSLTRRY